MLEESTDTRSTKERQLPSSFLLMRRARMSYEEFLEWVDEDTLAEWLVIDRAGRFKFKSTRVSAGPVKTQQLRRGRAFALSVEDKQVLTVTLRLNSEADVEPILQDLQLLVHGREALADRAVTGADTA